jgi:hypothetical protein
LEAHVRNTAAQIAFVVALATIAGCRNKESPTQAPAAREDRKPTVSSSSTPNSPPRVGKEPTTSGRPHVSDADLVQNMK